MLSIAELAHQRDPQAIAEIIRQELKLLDSSALEVEVAIVDSSLEIQIRTESAIDKEKLLTLVRSELENLHIESLAKFRIHCWRNDVEMHEQRLLWTEQFMLNLSKSSLTQTLELDTDKGNNLAETRSLNLPNLRMPDQMPERRPEAQLSKQSVLQQAIAQIAPNSQTAQTNLLAAESENANDQVTQSTDSTSSLTTSNFQVGQMSDVNYWQLIFIGASIVLLGLGIGAFVRAVTVKQDQELVSSSATSPITKTASTTKVKNTNQPSPTVTPTPSSISPSPNLLSSTASASPSPTDLNSPDSPSASPSTTQENLDVITLEKFNRVQKGMTLDQVENVFGTSGKVIAENSSGDSLGKVYSWKNPQGSNAIIEFKDGLVIAKAQAGL
ncbi:hypothetical protein H6F42_10695 [Pseudanabaena sp. FACHB-1998]|uniref:hypothetical protein n=1 Tax=Pseudanabaena sp. FACHB-1998 TaxID=2692858 RepID=UPI0016819C15|nr:hypothetical protein [Pseudanabaena sp. FACHB-1998]MBD2177379.1 hypothetical protein [Pseudanabaena sp. FACHB-1998]